LLLVRRAKFLHFIFQIFSGCLDLLFFLNLYLAFYLFTFEQCEQAGHARLGIKHLTLFSSSHKRIKRKTTKPTE
jgi:hypothetical protein